MQLSILQVIPSKYFFLQDECVCVLGFSDLKIQQIANLSHPFILFKDKFSKVNQYFRESIQFIF